MITVRAAKYGDAGSWLRMRRALWPDGSEVEHRQEIERFLAGQAREPLAVLLAEHGTGRVVGFAELSIRPYAEGCSSDRVAYLEGWFVVPEARRGGIGRALVAAAEDWARSQGCTEFASDTQPDNEASAAAHRALGFTDWASYGASERTCSHGSCLTSVRRPAPLQRSSAALPPAALITRCRRGLPCRRVTSSLCVRPLGSPRATSARGHDVERCRQARATSQSRATGKSPD